MLEKRQQISENTKRISVNRDTDKRTNTFQWIFVLGLAAGFMLIAFFSMVTLVSFLTIAKFLLLFGLIGNLIPYRWYFKKFVISRLEVFLWNFMFVGPLVTSLLFATNYFVREDNRPQVIEIQGIRPTSYGEMELLLKDSLYQDYSSVRIVSSEGLDLYHPPTHFILTTGEGLFGWEVVLDKEVK